MTTATARGFTLIEILVVVAIIGILATLVVQNVIDRPDEAREQAARSEMKTFDHAIQQFRLDHAGRLPNTFAELLGDNEKRRSYVDAQQDPPLDPWGREYLLDVVDRGVVIASPGLDGEPGTEDDITTENYKVRHRRQ